jgi:ribose 5-phosphate isomerase B
MEELKHKEIALASDHAGFERKQDIIKFLENRGIKYKDFGCFTDKSCDYPDFGHLIADAIDKGEYDTGITFCGSGQGISMTANKYPNVRSALCWIPEIAALARQHNDANICAIPGRFVTAREAEKIVETFLGSHFEGGRHARRISKIPVRKK